MSKTTLSGLILLISLITVIPFILLLIECVIFTPEYSHRKHSLLGQLVENLR